MANYIVFFSFLLSFILLNKPIVLKNHINSSPYNCSIKTRIKKCSLNDHNKTIIFLWREDKYNKKYKTTFSEIRINSVYCKKITDPERAILGYIATFIGSDCNWDGEYKSDRSNLKCKILNALDLGYQCSQTHLGFLKKWFRIDEKVLKRLEDCSTIPSTSTVQNTFDKIQITHKNKDFIVIINASGINSSEDRSWFWTEEYHFVLNPNNQLKLISQKKLKTSSAKL
jgi:hypothetical protein